MAQELELTSQQVIDLWFHYEEIAMHFNELIIQYRLQLLGGTGGLLALFSYLTNSKVENKEMRIRMRAFILTTFLMIFCAAAWLDVMYYSKLLSGAVESILELESDYSNLNFSTVIKDKFGRFGASFHIQLVYFFVIMPLVIFTGKFWFDYFRLNKSS